MVRPVDIFWNYPLWTEGGTCVLTWDVSFTMLYDTILYHHQLCMRNTGIFSCPRVWFTLPYCWGFVVLSKVFVFAIIVSSVLITGVVAAVGKQWSLTRHETITSFEAWRQNLQYILSRNFPGSPRRGLQDNPASVPQASRRTAQPKYTHLELMLGQIANYCPLISRNTIVKNSTSTSFIWKVIRLHFGFQSTGAHFLNFNNITLAPCWALRGSLSMSDVLYQRKFIIGKWKYLTPWRGSRHRRGNVSHSRKSCNIRVSMWKWVLASELKEILKIRLLNLK